jgi:hypothetical protein
MNIAPLLGRSDLKDLLHRLGREADYVLKGRLTVPGVAAMLTLGSVVWIVAGLGLRGRALALWLLVPLLVLVAGVCVGGPGHVISKRWEGRSLFELAPGDAVTMLDVTGLAIAGLAALLALGLLAWRARHILLD